MKINLHIGVHKTATTYIQNRLHANKGALHKAGIGYASLWEFRSFFTEKFMEFTPENFRLEDILGKFFGGHVPEIIHGLVISEENLIGYCGGLLNSGNPFSSARARLAHMSKLLEGHDVTMFCAVRAYDTFLSSAYCEGVRNLNEYVPFDEMRQKLHWARMQWPHLIQMFEENLKPQRTQIWRFEDFRHINDKVLDALTFETGMTLVPPGGGRNAEYPSYSGLTIETLDMLAKNMGVEIANALIQSIDATFPKGDVHKGFNPWGTNERKLMDRLYEQDCAIMDPAKWLIAPRSEVASGNSVTETSNSAPPASASPAAEGSAPETAAA
jgi:hypothetical protein